MTWLDSAIGWLSPVSGMRRMQARRAMDIHARAYDGAKRDHRTASWQAAGGSANAEIATVGRSCAIDPATWCATMAMRCRSSRRLPTMLSVPGSCLHRSA
ncbi:hypothetical protein ACFSUK_08120 [Sphingobium scionense]